MYLYLHGTFLLIRLREPVTSARFNSSSRAAPTLAGKPRTTTIHRSGILSMQREKNNHTWQKFQWRQQPKNCTCCLGEIFICSFNLGWFWPFYIVFASFRRFWPQRRRQPVAQCLKTYLSIYL